MKRPSSVAGNSLGFSFKFLILTLLLFTSSLTNTFATHVKKQVDYPVTLAAGDLVVLGIKHSTQEFIFASLVDIPAGTIVKITDIGWNNLSNSFIDPANANDGVVTWTLSAAVSAGDIFSLVLAGKDNSPATSFKNITKNTTLTSDISISGYTVDLVILTSGEQCIIYQGPDDNPFFIYGLNASTGTTTLNGSNWQNFISLNGPQSMLPNGAGSQNALTNGTTAVGILTNPYAATEAAKQFDNVYYTGATTSANRATWLARISNSSNWSGDDVALNQSSSGNPSVGMSPGSRLAIETPSPYTDGIVYVKKGANGNHSGSNWANAMPELADALKLAKSNTSIKQIWVAGGTYKPLYSPRDGANFANEGRDNAFLLVKDVKVYGGFAGTESSLDQRNLSITANASILSGDLAGNDVVTGTGATLAFSNFEENAYHIVIGNGDLGTGLLDGFTIKGANADNPNKYIYVNGYQIVQSVGGGIFANRSILNAENLKIIHNYAEYGAGVHSTNFAQLNLKNTIIAQNTGLNLSAVYANSYGNITIINSTIAGNKTFNTIGQDGASIVVKNSIIWGNSGNAFREVNTPVEYSIVQGGAMGTGNLDIDPFFTNITAGNYSLLAKSPAINGGSNTLYTGLNAATRDLAGNNRVYNYASAGIIDMGAFEFQGEPVPGVYSVTATTDDTYEVGDQVEFTVKFTHPVTVSGTPYIALKVGSRDRNAVYVSGSGTKNLVFRYTVQTGDNDTDGITMSTTIEDGDLGTAQRNLTGVPSLEGIIIDGGSAPQFLSTASTTAAYGQEYIYDIITKNSPGLRSTITAEELPGWLNLNLISESTLFATLPISGNLTGIVADDAGNIYVIPTNGTIIYKITPDGTTTEWKTGLQYSINYKLYIDEGYLYIPRNYSTTNSLTRIPLADPTTEEVVANNLGGFTSLALNGDWIYAVDYVNDKIVKIHKTTKTNETFLNLNFVPFDIAFGPNDEMYISAINEKSIYLYQDNVLTKIISDLPNLTTSVEVDAFGNLIVMIMNNGIRKYTSDFSSFEQISSKIGQLIDFSFRPDGTIIHTDNSNNIYEITPRFALTGTPSKAHLGEHQVTLRATNEIGSTDQTFTIMVVDETTPIVSSMSPANGTPGVELQPSLSLTFDEEIQLGSTGTLKLLNGSTVLRTYDLSVPADRDLFTLSEDDLTLNWTVDVPLPLNTLISVEISTGFVKDLSNNSFAGITAASAAWTFTTLNIQPDEQGILYVKKGGNGNKSGNSWANAIAEFADALKAAASITDIQQIWVAEGTYKPMYSPKDGDNFTDQNRDNAFLLVKDVKVYGGFAGNETSPAERAIKLHPTILSGDRNENDIRSGSAESLVLQNYTDNTYHVVIAAGDMGSATFDGFIIEGGNGDTPTPITVNGNVIERNEGGGIHIANASLTLSNLILQYNFATNGGGYRASNESEVTLVNTLFNKNFAQDGGAVYVSESSKTFIKNNTIVNSKGGSTIFFEGGDHSNIVNSIIWNNQSGVVMDADLITSSIVQNGYDGIQISDSDPLFTNAEENDFTLAENSPAIGRGQNSLYTNDQNILSTAKDLASNDRVYNLEIGGNIDLGAYEYQGLGTANIEPAQDIFRDYGTETEELPSLNLNINGFINYISSDETVAVVEDGEIVLKQAGETTVTYQVRADANYSDFDYSFKVVVEKIDVHIATTGATKVYGDEDPIIDFEVVSGLINNDTKANAFTGALSREHGEQVGEYYIDIGTLNARNYSLHFDFDEVKFTISPATLYVTALDTGKVYGQDDFTLPFEVTGYKFDEDAEIFDGSLTREVGQQVGEYEITIGSLVPSGNYIIDFTGATYTITPAHLILTPENYEKYYGDGDTQIDYIIDGRHEDDDPAALFSGHPSRDAGENVGEYEINAGNLTLLSPNYTWEFVPGTYTILPSTLNVYVYAKDKTYGDDDPEFEFYYDNLNENDDESVFTGALAREEGEQVGEYQILQGTLSAGNNYEIVFSPGAFTITPATLFVTVNENGSKVYGDEDPGFTITATGFKFNEDDSLITGEAEREAGENVDSYYVNVGSISAGPNYVIDFTFQEFHITPAQLNVRADNKSKTFGDADPSLTYTVTGWKRNDTVALMEGQLIRVDGEDYGDYAILQGDLTAGANYEIQFTEGLFSIAKAELTVIAAAKTKVYGESDPELTYTISGFKLDDDDSILTGTLTREEGQDVATYQILQGDLSGGENYTISYTPANFTITAATLTITPAQLSKVYGDDDPILNYSVSGYQYEDNASILSGTLTRVSGENVGTYAIQQGSLSANTNYSISLTPTLFEIEAATLTVLADTLAKDYGDTDPSLTYTIEGLKRSDNNSVLTGSLTRTVGEAVGTYPITQGTLAVGSNYVLNFIPAEFTINKIILTVTADAKTKVYGDVDPAFTFVATGFRNADNESILTGALNRNAGEHVGSYSITQGNLEAGNNYTINYVSAPLTITKATLTVAANNMEKVYGEEDPAYTYSAAGFKGADNVFLLTGSLDRSAGENVGTYAIDLGNLSAGNNYTITFEAGTLTITPASLTVKADTLSKTFGTADPALTYAVQGLKWNDTPSILQGQLTRQAGETVGTYMVNRGTIQAGNNYVLNFTPAPFTIQKAQLIITAANQTKVYGEADPALTYSVSGFMTGDDERIVSGALSRESGENAGTYRILQGSVRANDNYDITFNAGNLIISKAELSVVADAKSKVYGQADPSFTYTVSGFKGNDNASVLSGSLQRSAGENAGNYTIGLGSLSAGNNYTINFTGAVFKIAKATQTITFQMPASIQMTGNTVNLPGTASSGLALQYVVDNTNNATVTGSVLNPIHVGVIEITASQPGNENYEAATPVTVRVEIQQNPNAGNGGGAVIEIPLRVHPALSPNGDGINDFLFIENIREYSENQVVIFNANQKVMETIRGYNNQNNVFTGANYPNGTYYIVIEYKVGNEWKRHTGYFVLRK